MGSGFLRRRPRVHQPRYQRDCLGELVQIDDSPLDWFEGRAPNAACSSLLMTRLVACCTSALMRLNQPLIT